MNQFKRVQVIMLPTEQKFKIGEYTISKYPENLLNGRLLSGIKKCEGNVGEINQHLYIISDDEIKKGDWFIHHSHEITTLLKAIDVKDRIFDNQGTSCCKSYCKKIIATTDKTLSQTSRTEIPQPSQQFITKYIESYNKGEIITDVLVEYNNINVGPNLTKNLRYYPDNFELKLKINSKDNTITIKKVKDSYSREEVIKLFNKLYKDFDMISESFYNKWIEENL